MLLRFSPHRRTQGGNALFLILIAVALFAALSYAVTKSGRGSGSINKEQAQLKAARLMAYMGTIQSAITRMVLSGTDPAALQFTTAPNTPCASGATCVFAPDGGGVAYLDWPNFFEVAPSGVRFFAAGAGGFVQGVGSASDEVMLVITGGAGYAVDGLCGIINPRLGLPLLAGMPSNQPFNTAAPPFTLDSLPGKTEGCGRENSGSNYYFYYVFYPR